MADMTFDLTYFRHEIKRRLAGGKGINDAFLEALELLVEVGNISKAIIKRYSTAFTGKEVKAAIELAIGNAACSTLALAVDKGHEIGTITCKDSERCDSVHYNMVELSKRASEIVEYTGGPQALMQVFLSDLAQYADIEGIDFIAAIEKALKG